MFAIPRIMKNRRLLCWDQVAHLETLPLWRLILCAERHANAEKIQLLLYCIVQHMNSAYILHKCEASSMSELAAHLDSATALKATTTSSSDSRVWSGS